MDERAGHENGWRDTSLGGWREAPTFRWLGPGELIDIPVPATALELDALLRHLEIDADFGDWSKAANHLDQARAVWGRLEAPLASRLKRRGHLKGAVLAAQEMATAVERLEETVGACAGDDVARLARWAIDLVEVIEQALE